jgi:hypothetical protein
MKDIHYVAHSSNLMPKTRSVFLPHLQQNIDLTTFSIHALIYDLLTNPELDIDESYLFLRNSSPLDRPNQFPPIINDLDTGQRYINSWNKLQNQPFELPFPIQTFLDKANVTTNDRLVCEVLMVQLGIHNQDTRYQAASFRNLGSMPRLDLLPYKPSDALKKLKDYHFCLDVLFSEFKAIMSSSAGIPWVFQFEKRLYRVLLKPYLIQSIGDTPGHNQLGAKLMGPEVEYKCRYCNCPQNSLEDPTFKFKLIKWKHYNCEHNSEDLMKQRHSMHFIENALEQLEYGSTEHGVMSLLLAEIIHAVQLGCHSRLQEGVVSTSLCTKDTYKEEAIIYQERLSSGWNKYQAPEKDDQSTSISPSSSSSSSSDEGSANHTFSNIACNSKHTSDYNSDDESKIHETTDWMESNSVSSFHLSSGSESGVDSNEDDSISLPQGGIKKRAKTADAEPGLESPKKKGKYMSLVA